MYDCHNIIIMLDISSLEELLVWGIVYDRQYFNLRYLKYMYEIENCSFLWNLSCYSLSKMVFLNANLLYARLIFRSLSLAYNKACLYFSTRCFSDFGKLNLPTVVRFQAQAKFHYCPSCLKKQSLRHKWSKPTQK
jgi:hypothetical protein